MRIDIYHHLHGDDAKLNEVLALLRGIKHQGEGIMADTQATLAKLAALSATVDNLRGDIQGLKDLIAAGGTPQEVSDAVDAILAKANALDAETP